MDQLKDSVGLRGFAEKDPRIEYKREGANQFRQMQVNVRDRVTELIFHAKLTPNVQLENVYDQQQAEHEEVGSSVASAQPAAAQAQGTQQQQADLAAAEQAGSDEAGDGQAQGSRHERRAAKARQRQRSHGGGKKQRKKKSR
jgi:preprotein translocase subunit SecA